MVWLIAKREFHDNWISHRITLAFALCVILLTVSLGLALKDYSERLSSHDLASAADAYFIGNVANYVFRNEEGRFYSMNIGDIVGPVGIHRRPAELSILARGLEDRMNRPVRFSNIRKTGFQIQADVGNVQERNKLFALFSPPDFLSITRVVLSLLTILFTFSAIAGERESGTLKLVLSNSMSRGQLLLGKFLGGYASLAVPFLAALLLALLLVALSPAITLGGEGWLRILLMVLTSLVYAAIFFFVGLAVSALSRRSATAVLVLLAVWVISTLVIPNVGWLIGKRAVEVPSQQQIDTERFKTSRRIEDEAEKKYPSNSFLPGYGKYHIEAQPDIEKAMKGIEERYEALRRRRLALSQTLTRLSPVGAYVYITSSLAQTGIEDEKRYHQQLKQHEAQLSEDNKELLSKIQGLMSAQPPQTDDPHEFRSWMSKQLDSVFDFGKKVHTGRGTPAFERSSLSDTLQAIRGDLLLLILWMGAALVFATLATIKCSVRS